MAAAQGDCDYTANCPPLAGLSASPNPAYQGQVVVLDGTGSSDGDGDPLTYRWDLDGNGVPETPTGHDSQIATAFFTTGSNRVGLRVTDPANQSDMAFAFVQIVTNPLLAPPAVDHTPPGVRLSRISRSLRRALRRGIAVRLRCSEACVMGAGGTLQRSTSRQFKVRGRKRNLSKAHRALTKAGSRRLVLKLSRSARRRLREAPAARITLRFAVTDPFGNTRRVRRSIRLHR
jgi:hypothetical protein